MMTFLADWQPIYGKQRVWHANIKTIRSQIAVNKGILLLALSWRRYKMRTRAGKNNKQLLSNANHARLHLDPLWHCFAASIWGCLDQI